MCSPSEFAATSHHTIDNYTRADLQLRDIVALSTERKSRVDTGVQLFVSLIIFLMKQAHAQTKYVGHENWNQ